MDRALDLAEAWLHWCGESPWFLAILLGVVIGLTIGVGVLAFAVAEREVVVECVPAMRSYVRGC